MSINTNNKNDNEISEEKKSTFWYFPDMLDEPDEGLRSNYHNPEDCKRFRGNHNSDESYESWRAQDTEYLDDRRSNSINSEITTSPLQESLTANSTTPNKNTSSKFKIFNLICNLSMCSNFGDKGKSVLNDLKEELSGSIIDLITTFDQIFNAFRIDNTSLSRCVDNIQRANNDFQNELF